MLSEISKVPNLLEALIKSYMRGEVPENGGRITPLPELRIPKWTIADSMPVRIATNRMLPIITKHRECTYRSRENGIIISNTCTHTYELVT